MKKTPTQWVNYDASQDDDVDIAAEPEVDSAAIDTDANAENIAELKQDEATYIS